jgi:pimeloyl-ACP methyl ester carboxylesterase
VLAGVVLLGVVAVGLTVLRLRAAVMPRRTQPTRLDFAAVGLAVREVQFAVPRLGRIEGQPLPLAIRLSDERVPLLLFDFRGHGASGGRGSTLGAAEKRDVLGALDFARGMEGVEHARLGVYGAGMGAHAAVLAARERPAARVLVLDGLYPDPQFALLRRFYGGWDPPLPRAEFLPVGVFRAMSGNARDEPAADGVVSDLTGRDLLFLAPESDEALAREIERMYGLVPLQADVDGNLVRVPTSAAGVLYGADRERHDGEVAEFFASRLPQAAN